MVEAKVANLEELHDADGRHAYRGVLEGDLEWFLRHRVAAMLTATGAWIAEKDPRAIEDPAGECLENLLDLEAFGASDPRIAGRQVEWFARLAVEDPYRLSRERCTLALGRAGKRLRAGVPVALEKGATASGPEALSAALARLVASFRRLVETRGPASATALLDFEADCDVVRGLPLDLDGARRALRVTNDLVRAAGLSDPEFDAVRRLDQDLQAVCVRRALASALLDKDAVVRAAAAEGSVECAGNAVLVPMLAQLPREAAPEVVTRVLHLVARHGLPGAPADLAPEQALALRERSIDSIYAIVVERPDSRVRVAAMLALERVSDGAVSSLREEDWQAWWQARRAGRDVQDHEDAAPGGARGTGP
jgi:hypothetical protein